MSLNISSFPSGCSYFLARFLRSDTIILYVCNEDAIIRPIFDVCKLRKIAVSAAFMKITLILTGKTKAGYLQEGVDDYLKRMRRYVPLAVETIPDLKIPKKMNTELVKKLEGQQILQRIKSADHVILLDERGKRFTSEAFAAHLQSLEGRTGHTVFVVGGAYGFSEEVVARGDQKLSLSDMTFSHQMVRLIFSEQLYRAYSILNGEPYHHK
jgi:23S rRNA (pseudouridine1915-N3)-methyltransferase